MDGSRARQHAPRVWYFVEIAEASKVVSIDIQASDDLSPYRAARCERGAGAPSCRNGTPGSHWCVYPGMPWRAAEEISAGMTLCCDPGRTAHEHKIMSIVECIKVYATVHRVHTSALRQAGSHLEAKETTTACQTCRDLHAGQVRGETGCS